MGASHRGIEGQGRQAGVVNSRPLTGSLEPQGVGVIEFMGFIEFIVSSVHCQPKQSLRGSGDGTSGRREESYEVPDT
jgi:hypothetical protein